MTGHIIPQAKDATTPVESKFRAILLIAQRARQIQAGAKPFLHTIARKATRIARDEFRAGLLSYETLPAPVR